MMKIMHIAGGGDRGGAKPHILSLCSQLKKNNELRLFSLRTGEFSDDAAACGIDTTTIYSGFVLRDYFRLVRYARKWKPDIVHCHGAKANIGGVFLKVFCGATIVTTVHSDYRLDYMHSFLRRNTIGRLNAAALRLFDYYVTVSDTFRRMLIGRGFSPLRIMTIYNGLDFSQKAPPVDKAEYLRAAGLDYHPGDVVLGIPARLNPVKDLPTLLEAFALAKKQNPHIKLLIGGDGEDKDKLVALAQQLGISDSVSFLGWVSDVPRFFAACDIDVLCSISESFPYSILEGIREGCAVITSDVGGMRKLISHGEDGYIFQPKDVETFTKYIVDLSLNEERRRLFAKRLYDKASETYSLEGMARRQYEIYETICSKEERRRKNPRDGVLICGAYGRGNAGDEAILKAIIAAMRSIDPLMPLTVMTRKPQETEALHGVRAVYTFRFPAFLRCMRKTRLFINGGGSLIQDITSSRSLYFYLFTIWAARHLGCRVLMYGCGIGHVQHKRNRRLAARILNANAEIITLRDAVSKRELSEMGITRPDIRMAADPAMSLSPADEQEADEFFRLCGISEHGKYLCFSLRPWMDFDRFEIFAKAGDYAYDKYGMTTIFLPIELPKDLEPSRRAAQAMHSPHYILETGQDVGLTIALMKKMQAVCAMRLHALVFSAAAGVPFIATSYDIKVNGFMEYVGSSACCGLHSLTLEWLCNEIDAAISRSSRQAGEAVSAKLAALEKENARAAKELLA